MDVAATLDAAWVLEYVLGVVVGVAVGVAVVKVVQIPKSDARRLSVDRHENFGEFREVCSGQQNDKRGIP
jgi:hypothetical protein